MPCSVHILGIVVRRAKHICNFLLCLFVLQPHLQTEVNYLGQLRHPNLVKLIGYCSEGDSRLLVYEFMPRGSLENHLFRSELLIFLGFFWVV